MMLLTLPILITESFVQRLHMTSDWRVFVMPYQLPKGMPYFSM